MNESKDTATGEEMQHCGQPMLLAVFGEKESIYCERCGFSEDAGNPSLPPLDESERQPTCVRCMTCDHYGNVDESGTCRERGTYPVQGGESRAEACGCKCEFSPSPTQERTYCPTCKIFCVLPNHCDNCGGDLVAPIQPSKREQGVLEKIWVYERRTYPINPDNADMDYAPVEYIRADLARSDVTQQSVWDEAIGCVKQLWSTDNGNQWNGALNTVIRELEKAKAKSLAAAPERPRIICLCGSTRFIQTWIDEYQRLSDEGNIVLTVARMPPRPNLQHDEPELKSRLDVLHKQKIDIADEVYVLDVDGYIGASTQGEIAHAETKGKPVRYLSVEQPNYRPPTATSQSLEQLAREAKNF